MHIRLLSAVATLAAMGVLAGCGPNGQNNNDTGQTSAGQPVPPPEQSMPNPVPNQPPASEPSGSMAGSSQPGTSQSGGSSSMGAENQPMGQGAGANGQGQMAPSTEFAAMDTDADGTLDQSEWQPNAAHGMDFDQVDADSSGSIDPQEFKQAIGPGSAGSGASGAGAGQSGSGQVPPPSQ